MTSTLRIDDPQAVRQLYEDFARSSALRYDMVSVLIDPYGSGQGMVVEITDVEPDPPSHDRALILRRVLGPVDGTGDRALAALVVSRPGPSDVGGSDLAWHDPFAAACRAVGARCCGTFVATPRGVVGPIVARALT